MTPADAQSALEKYFAPWVRALDLKFIDIAPGKAVATMPIKPDLMRIGEILSGQALATMADTIMVFACAAQEGAFKSFATTNLDTQFLRAGVGDLIRCEAEVVKPGKAIYFARATMYAEPSGKAVAEATATFYIAG